MKEAYTEWINAIDAKFYLLKTGDTYVAHTTKDAMVYVPAFVSRVMAKEYSNMIGDGIEVVSVNLMDVNGFDTFALIYTDLDLVSMDINKTISNMKPYIDENYSEEMSNDTLFSMTMQQILSYKFLDEKKAAEALVEFIYGWTSLYENILNIMADVDDETKGKMKDIIESFSTSGNQ